MVPGEGPSARVIPREAELKAGELGRMAALQRALEARNIVFVVGTGVSAGITAGAKTATWVGLIESGRDRLVELNPSLKGGWENVVNLTLGYALENQDVSSLVNAAGMVSAKFKEISPQAFANWLSADIGELPRQNLTNAQALLKLPYPILTTNYDTLLETVGRRDSACWTEAASIQQVLAGTSNSIGHIHGVWDRPDSVVLSESDYTTLLASDAAQHLQRAASSIKSLVYVGFGSGLDDPNFASLLEWHRTTFSQSGITHFRLCRSSDLESLRAAHKSDNIEPIVYGDGYDDLAGFLESLSPSAAEVQLTDAGIARDLVAEAQQALVDDLKGELVIAEEVDDERDISDLVLPPIILPVPHADFVKARSSRDGEKIDRLDPVGETQEGELVLLVSEEGSGLTTALKWMAWQASIQVNGAAPLYVNFKSCRRTAKPLEEQVRSAARTVGLAQGKGSQLPPYTLALDDLSPYVDRISDRVIEALTRSAAVYTVIGCKQGQEDDLLERLKQAGLSPRVRYLGKLSSQDIADLARIAAPSRHKEIAKSVVDILSSESLPRTPFTASLLISILLRGGTLVASASQTAVLEQYVSLLLGRGDPHEDARFNVDQSGREVMLANLAERFVTESVTALPEASVVNEFETMFAKFGWVESPSAMLTNFVDRRVLKRSGQLIQFSRTSYLHLFAAKRAVSSVEFLVRLKERPLYYMSILAAYAAIARNDSRLLTDVASLLDDAKLRVLEKGSPFQELPLVDAPNPAEVQEPDGPEAEDPEPRGLDSVEHDDLLDLPDTDIPAFFGEPDKELPPAIRLMRTLNLVSTVLRDSDQIEDLVLKQEVLTRALSAWGNLVSVFSADRSFQDLVERISEELDVSGIDMNEVGSRRDFMDEFARTIPASVVLGGIEATLATRKLLKVLASALEAGELSDSEEQTIAAVFLIYVLGERGWPAQLRKLLRDQGNIWIVRNFVLWLCVMAYVHRKNEPADEADLVELCVEIVGRGTRYGSQAEKSASLGLLRQNLSQARLQHSKALTVGS